MARKIVVRKTTVKKTIVREATRRPERGEAPKATVKRSGKTGARGAALPGGVIEQAIPDQGSPGASSMTGRAPKDHKPPIELDIGTDEHKEYPRLAVKPPTSHHWRSKK